MHITSINVNGYWVNFEIENVHEVDKDGKVCEKLQAVATFIKDGQDIHKIYNIGDFDYCAKLLDCDFAKREVIRMMDTANKSKHSPFI